MSQHFRHLYPQITSWENLLLAWRKARKGKRGRPPAATFEWNAAENLLTLQRELEQKSYRPGGYVSFTIHEPKRRLISAAPFRDRVVHHALCNVIEPIFERRFIHDSYANRRGKGTHAALDRCQHFARHHRYVLQADIAQFFPAIDHKILLETHKVEHLNKADIELKGLRKNLLLAHELGLFNDGQFRHVTGLVSEVGALLGSWLNPKPKTTPGAQSGAKPGASG
jgi:retron-type reverse transcriptase